MDKKIFIGWSGGLYEDAGLYKTKKAAENGISLPDSDKEYCTMFEEFNGKKIRITVEVIED